MGEVVQVRVIAALQVVEILVQVDVEVMSIRVVGSILFLVWEAMP
jgi:hypothetical protein